MLLDNGMSRKYLNTKNCPRESTIFAIYRTLIPYVSYLFAKKNYVYDRNNRANGRRTVLSLNKKKNFGTLTLFTISKLGYSNSFSEYL